MDEIFANMHSIDEKKKTWKTNQGYTFRPSIRSIQNILIHFFITVLYEFFFNSENSLDFCFDQSYNISRQHFSSFIQDHNQWFFFLKNAFCNRSSRSLLNSVHMHFRLDFKFHELIVWQCRHSCQLNAFMSTHFKEKVWLLFILLLSRFFVAATIKIHTFNVKAIHSTLKQAMYITRTRLHLQISLI